MTTRTALIGSFALAGFVGAAIFLRPAGEIFDEPSLARPIAGDELNGILPEVYLNGGATVTR